MLAVAAGLAFVGQQTLNTGSRKAVDSAAWVGLVSYGGGTFCTLALALGPARSAAATGVGRPRPGILLLPRLGATTFVALLVAGRMPSSLVFDRFGLFGLARRPAEPARLLGIALLVDGVVLVRRYWRGAVPFAARPTGTPPPAGNARGARTEKLHSARRRPSLAHLSEGRGGRTARS